MTEEQVERVLMVALRRREEMAEEVATLILNAPIETFLPVASRAAFMEWDRITTLAEMNAVQFKRVEERDAEITALKDEIAALQARLGETTADRQLRMIRGAA